MGRWGSRKRAALCAASAAVIGICAWQMLGAGEGVRFARTALLVDAATGDLFEFSLASGRAVSIPARNPDTGLRSLLPVYEKDGRWVLAGRELAALNHLDVQPAAIDRKTGEVRVAGRAREVGEW